MSQEFQIGNNQRKRKRIIHGIRAHKLEFIASISVVERIQFSFSFARMKYVRGERA